MELMIERLANVQRAAAELNPSNLAALKFDLKNLIALATKAHDLVRRDLRKAERPARPYLNRQTRPASDRITTLQRDGD